LHRSITVPRNQAAAPRRVRADARNARADARSCRRIRARNALRATSCGRLYPSIKSKADGPSGWIDTLIGTGAWGWVLVTGYVSVLIGTAIRRDAQESLGAGTALGARAATRPTQTRRPIHGRRRSRSKTHIGRPG